MSAPISQKLYQSFSASVIPGGGIVWPAALTVKATRTPISVKIATPRLAFTATAADTEVALLSIIPTSMRPNNDVVVPCCVSIGGVYGATWHTLITTAGHLIFRVNSVAMAIGTAYVVNNGIIEYDATTLTVS